LKKIEYYEIVYDGDFENNFNRLLKKKNFRSLPDQIEQLANALRQGTFAGDVILHYDEPTPIDVYKLRLPNPDANAGKSNGYRVIYAVVTVTKIVIILTMYYKKEQESITDTYIHGLLDGITAEYIPVEPDNEE
jgi:mRNA-degrading endonuclease RelE of RelBE toxin-antitoxin system